MLNLIKSGKSGKNHQAIDGVSINLKTFFKKSEDSLTSSIFERLFYLPADTLLEILTGSLMDDELKQLKREVDSFEFWPWWNLEDGHNEPDLLIKLKEFDLIIEAKRNDDDYTQDQQQWENEMQAYWNEYGKEKPHYLLAIGGFGNKDRSTSILPLGDSIFKVFKIKWDRIILKIKEQIRAIEIKEMQKYNPELNILKDMISWFDVHGFNTGELFETMPVKYSIASSSIDSFNIYKEFIPLPTQTFQKNPLNISTL